MNLFIIVLLPTKCPDGTWTNTVLQLKQITKSTKRSYGTRMNLFIIVLLPTKCPPWETDKHGVTIKANN